MQIPAYQEAVRPQFHFTAQSGWLNDPNGLVYHRGEYHLFFQHNPFGTQWGNMTWGHAVSKDLVHWKQLPSAITPNELGTVFSGSAVVDHANTAGFGKGSLVCIYTAAGGTNDASKGKPFTQCLASSKDGRTFEMFRGNPVLNHVRAENRDPKVIWHGPSRKWVMALYLDASSFALYGSADLKNWTHLSDVQVPGASECPDFFEMALDGNSKKKKWVFWAANGTYLVGSFDGNVFKAETEALRSDFGNTSYAAQTYFDAPKNRRIQIAWFRGSEFPGMPWNQQMGFPVDLSLRATADGPRLAFKPVQEIANLRSRRIKPSETGYYTTNLGLLDAAFTFKVPATGQLTLVVNGQTILFDAEKRVLRAGGKEAIVLPSPALELRVLADRASLEIFAQGGLVSMPLYVSPNSDRSGISLRYEGEWKLVSEEVYDLKSSWGQ